MQAVFVEIVGAADRAFCFCSRVNGPFEIAWLMGWEQLPKILPDFIEPVFAGRIG
jgi:hypothetical protein